MSFKRIMITGGSGRVGEFVIKELAKDYELIVLDVNKPKNIPENIHYKFIQKNIKEIKEIKEAFRDIDVVIHLAAIPVDLPGLGQEILELNVMGTFNLLEAMVKNGVKKLVFASSMCAIINCFCKEKSFVPDYFPVDEDHPSRSNDFYGLSKVIGEEICHAFSRKNNMSAICLRLGSILFPDGGEGTKNDVSRYAKPELGKHVIWTYVDVRDVAQAFRLSLKKLEKEDVGYEIYNIGANDVLSRTDSLDLIRQYYQEVKLISNENGFLIDKKRALFNISKAKEKLGYEPLHNWEEYLNIYPEIRI